MFDKHNAILSFLPYEKKITYFGTKGCHKDNVALLLPSKVCGLVLFCGHIVLVSYIFFYMYHFLGKTMHYAFSVCCFSDCLDIVTHADIYLYLKTVTQLKSFL